MSDGTIIEVRRRTYLGGCVGIEIHLDCGGAQTTVAELIQWLQENAKPDSAVEILCDHDDRFGPTKGLEVYANG